MTRRALTVCNGCDRVMATDEPFVSVIFTPTGVNADGSLPPPSGDYCDPCRAKLAELVTDLLGHFEIRTRPERVYGY